MLKFALTQDTENPFVNSWRTALLRKTKDISPLDGISLVKGHCITSGLSWTLCSTSGLEYEVEENEWLPSKGTTKYCVSIVIDLISLKDGQVFLPCNS